MKKSNPNIRDYFLSAWIGNFGVEPLLRSCAFLFLPMALFLAFLRTSVCFVLDTMKALLFCANSSLFSASYLLFFRQPLVHGPTQKVKNYLLLFFLVFATIPHGNELIAGDRNEVNEDMTLSIGEHFELSMKEIQQFSIGNKQVLAHSIHKKKNSLLIKGQRMGFSELILWGKKGIKKYQIYVVSKREQLKLGQLAKFAQKLKLKTQVLGNALLLEGRLSDIYSYQALMAQLYNLDKNQYSLKIEISDELKRTIMAKLTVALLEQYIDEFNCKFEGPFPYCNISHAFWPDDNFQNVLKQKYFVTFNKIFGNNNENFRVKLKFVQMESSDTSAMNLGLEKVSGGLGDFFHFSLENILSRNSYLLESQDVTFHLLAEPSIIIRPNQESIIAIGQETPYENKDQQLGINKLEWKFTGLKISLNIKKKGQFYELSYENKFNHSGGNTNGSISENMEKSSVDVELGQAIKLFEVALKGSGKMENRMPYLGKIPLIGRLFTSSNENISYKKITALVLVEKIDSEQ